MQDKPMLQYNHKSVLVNEVIEQLNLKKNKTYVDVTFGGGGHTKAILEAEPTCRVIAVDWDKKAVEMNAPALEEQYDGRLRVLWGNFASLYMLLKKEKIHHVDGILADFGTSQFQIHEKDGFSFSNDTPLDMRMSNAHSYTKASELVNYASERELTQIFFEFGEEKHSKIIAKTIIEQRKIKPIETTKQLADLIDKLISRTDYRKKGTKIHPATKVFQALRIAVNHELAHIETFLKAVPKLLNPEGRLVCISFHSLEDRLVKNFLKWNGNELKTVTKKPVMASPEELLINPSARSAKLRSAEKHSLDVDK